MSNEAGDPTEVQPASLDAPRGNLDLFLISVLLLFLELAFIRWFPAHVLYLTFFTNTVLLACFLGMSLGCLAVKHRRNYLAWTPFLLLLIVAGGVGFDSLRAKLREHLDVGGQGAAPGVVYFGTEYYVGDPTKTGIVPIEVIAGLFFVTIALTMVGPGQELGRALSRSSNRVQAYTINILGSIVGIVLFSFCSWLELPPLGWFLPVAVGLAYFLILNPERIGVWTGWAGIAALGMALFLVSLSFNANPAGLKAEHEQFWSPYYRIDYTAEPYRLIEVNLIGHQQMLPRNTTGDNELAQYALPYLLNRDAHSVIGQHSKTFRDVLIIGAGSGNDVSRALEWGPPDMHIDAVEIDPVIARLGKLHHPDKPYEDPRVTLHLDDGRNFLRSSDKKYDLIVFALVDSLVLHSSYSNIRLESYLFTLQAFQDVRGCLKPGGLFVMYNYFRQGWIIARLKQGLNEAFEAEPLVLALPYQARIEPDKAESGITMIIAGAPDATEPFRKAMGDGANYWLPRNQPLGREVGNGFRSPDPAARGSSLLLAQDGTTPPWQWFGLAKVDQPHPPLRTATDDWPFLYVKEPMIPPLNIRGAAIMGVLALLLLAIFLPRSDGEGSRWSFDGRMFFLGAGFMLIETKAVVHMGLLFGSTWMVNSVVFFAVLVMILAANLFVLRFRPEKLSLFYGGLLVSLLLNVLVPLDFFLGVNRTVQVVGSCVLVFAPIVFAGVIFAVSFGRTTEPDRAFGANIAGAMAGGLAEYSSMLLGFQYLILVAVAFYCLSALFSRKAEGTPRTDGAEPVGVKT